jgi:pyridoxine 4-dehydrogenase
MTNWRTAGTSAVRAGQVALGCGGFSVAETLDAARAIATIRAAAEGGIDLFDSARAYAPVGDPLHNERLLRKALGDASMVSTKGGHHRVDFETWDVDNSPQRLRADVEDSLRALNTDHITLYYIHRADSGDRIEDAVAALDELRLEGKIAAIGISNVTPEQVDKAVAIAPIAAVQNHFSATGRESVDVLARCESYGIPFFAYSPFGGPRLAGSLDKRLPTLAARAAQRGVSLHRLTLRAVLACSPVMSVVAAAGRVATAQDLSMAPSEVWDVDDQFAYESDLTSLKEKSS